MAKKRPAKKSRPADRSSEYVRGGKGRRDDVRGSRIFPIDAPNAPAFAEIIGAGSLGEDPHARVPAKRPTAALMKKPS